MFQYKRKKNKNNKYYYLYLIINFILNCIQINSFQVFLNNAITL